MVDLNLEQNASQRNEESYLSDFCEKIGMRYFIGSDCMWRSMGLRLFVPTPSCFPVTFSPDDLKLMWGNGAWFVQHVVREQDPGFDSYMFFVKDKSYDLATIKSRDRRHNIRRSLKHCTVDIVSFDLLAREGQRLIHDTYLRQGRNCGNQVLNRWNDYFTAASSNPLFRGWGAFVGKELAAAKIEFKFKGGIHPEAIFSRTDLLKYYTTNALLFVSTKETMKMDNTSYICYGLRPVTGEKQSLIDFKESLGFQRLPVKERLEVNPRLKLLCNKLSYKFWPLIPRGVCERSEYARLLKGILMTCSM